MINPMSISSRGVDTCDAGVILSNLLHESWILGYQLGGPHAEYSTNEIGSVIYKGLNDTSTRILYFTLLRNFYL